MSRSPISRDLRTLPNIMSLSRIFGVVLAAALYIYGFRIEAVVLGFLLGMSDYADGMIARRRNQVTELGAILDRLGDLVFELTAFALAVYLHFLHPVFLVLYCIREFCVGAAREYVGKVGGESVPSSIFGKLKTNFLSYALLVMYVVHAGITDHADVLWVGNLLLHIGVVAGLVFSYISGFLYVRAFVRTYNRFSNA